MGPSDHNAARRWSAGLFSAALTTYVVLSYGGIRSPDSEIVFRTAESLALRGHFAVDQELSWKGFGLSRGEDGEQYAIFGPGQSIAFAPLVGLGHALASTEPGAPVSSYTGDRVHIGGHHIDDWKPHRVRHVAVLGNALVGALTVCALFALALRMTGSLPASILLGVLFGWSSLWVPYTGTFFSEPLATLFTVLSLLWIAPTRDAQPEQRPSRVLGAGLCLGAAVWVHITAVLFAPFFGLLVALGRARDETAGHSWRRAAYFAAGVCVLLLLLGLFNHGRFGDALQTGRTNPDSQGFGYGVWTAPWEGMAGLLVSAGKGLLWYCPAAIFGLFCLGRMARTQGHAAVLLGAAVVVRWLFIAARSDWHGGFGPGPRYLVMAIPFALLPLSFVASQAVEARDRRTLLGMLAFALLACAQQLYLAIGEVFLYGHMVTQFAARQGVDLFKDNLLYHDWSVSPLLQSLSGPRAPHVLLHVPLSNAALWGVLCAVAALAFTWLGRRLLLHVMPP